MDLGLVAAGVAPLGQRRRIPHLGRLVVALHHRQLRGVQPRGRRPDSWRRDRQQQVAHRAVVPDPADELPHHAQTPAGAHAPGLRCEITGNEVHERGLARPVRAD